MNNRDAPAQCTVTRSHVIALIDAITYMLGSSEYEPPVADDEHYQSLVSNQVEAAFALAEEVAVDLWTETAAPVGREDAPVAVLLRDADAAYGLPKACAVPGCHTRPVLCCPRPAHLPTHTRWPSCAELCVRHTTDRHRIFARRVQRDLPSHHGSIDAALMPLPALASLAPSPEELQSFETAN